MINTKYDELTLQLVVKMYKALIKKGILTELDISKETAIRKDKLKEHE